MSIYLKHFFTHFICRAQYANLNEVKIALVEYSVLTRKKLSSDVLQILYPNQEKQECRDSRKRHSKSSTKCLNNYKWYLGPDYEN